MLRIAGVTRLKTYDEDDEVYETSATTSATTRWHVLKRLLVLCIFAAAMPPINCLGEELYILELQLRVCAVDGCFLCVWLRRHCRQPTICAGERILRKQIEQRE
jgi:hypothetical protein